MSMEFKSSSPTSGGLSPPDSVCDPDEKEISDDDDDDRNHKHRRTETTSQSLERDSPEQAFTHPYRKRNRPFDNGQSDPLSHYNSNNSNRDFSKRRMIGANFSRFSGEHGSGRGRGRNFQRDSRFGSVDLASQMAHPGLIPSAIFSGRGLPVSNPQSGAWGGFGLIPAIPNGAIDPINPLGLPGLLGPQLNPSMNMGIQRQRCRDFEERGFCLRGDRCPMEHGVNRIVVEDVQSLSQFNLPVSLPSAHIVGTSAGSGFGPSTSVSSSTLINSRGLHSRTNRSPVDEETLSVAVNTSGADLYDPDQPLWNNDGETSSPLLGVQPSNLDESVSFTDVELSDHVVRSSGDAIGSQGTSSTVWGRLKNSRNKMEVKEKFVPRVKASQIPESRTKELHEPSSGTLGNLHVGKQNNGAPFGPKSVGSISKLQNEVGGNVRKPSQKAQRTLFVNCIPLKDNKKENLLSHFRKFGEVIDIYIPGNSERAFVQFSKHEEAEKALKAPDAVMGSRFIKLWWANRDSIPDESTSKANSVPITPHDVVAGSKSSHLTVTNKGKDGVQYAALKVAGNKPSDNLLSAGNEFKPVAVNSPTAAPLAQKKMENLELLKEELRKKQEMLERKRNEFRQQLDKLAKQAPGKVEVSTVPAEKRQNVETSRDESTAGSTKPSDVIVSIGPSQSEVSEKVEMASLTSQRPKADSSGVVPDPATLKQPLRPTVSPGAQFIINRYKLDNRPTTFGIIAPLPVRLANIAALRDHFSIYGEISNMEIEDLNEESPNGITFSEEMKNCSVRISFATRAAAERAFLNGKSWRGHNLQFNWVTSSKPASSRSSGESSSALRGISNAEVQSAEERVGPKEPRSSSPKSSNEPSCDSSRSTSKEKSPAAANEKHSAFEVQSPDKSASFIPLEADELENRDFELQDGVSNGDGMKADEDLVAG